MLAGVASSACTQGAVCGLWTRFFSCLGVCVPFASCVHLLRSVLASEIVAFDYFSKPGSRAIM